VEPVVTYEEFYNPEVSTADLVEPLAEVEQAEPLAPDQTWDQPPVAAGEYSEPPIDQPTIPAGTTAVMPAGMVGGAMTQPITSQITASQTKVVKPKSAKRKQPVKAVLQWWRGLRRRRHLYLSDVLATATLGPRSRPVRAILSAIGIGIGITALIAVIGVPASIQAQKVADYDAWGANVLQVLPKQDQRTGEVTPIPDSAPAMVSRIAVVKAVPRSSASTPAYFAATSRKTRP